MLKLKENQEIIPISAKEEKSAENFEIESFKNGFKITINDIIQQSWGLVNNINSILTTVNIDPKVVIDDNILEILNSIINDVTIDIGMLYKVIEMLDSKTSELIEVGEEKAEDVIDSVESNDATNDEFESADIEEPEE